MRNNPKDINNCNTFSFETDSSTAKICSCSPNHEDHHTDRERTCSVVHKISLLKYSNMYGFALGLSRFPMCYPDGNGGCNSLRGIARTKIYANNIRYGNVLVRQRPFGLLSEMFSTSIHEVGHVFGGTHHEDDTYCVMNVSMSKRPLYYGEDNDFCQSCASIILYNLNTSRLASAALLSDSSKQNLELSKQLIEEMSCALPLGEEILYSSRQQIKLAYFCQLNLL